jgi:hypothetical protein
MKLFNSNLKSIFQADIAVIGVPYESRSHAKRKAASNVTLVLRL